LESEKTCPRDFTGKDILRAESRLLKKIVGPKEEEII
jgi:hypothetical protein